MASEQLPEENPFEESAEGAPQEEEALDEDFLVVLPDEEGQEWSDDFFEQAEAAVDAPPLVEEAPPMEPEPFEEAPVTEADETVIEERVEEPVYEEGAEPIPVTVFDVAPDGFPAVEPKVWEYLEQGYIFFVVGCGEVLTVEDLELQSMAELDGEVRERGGQLVFSALQDPIREQVQALDLYDALSLTESEEEATDWMRKVVMENTGSDIQVGRVPITAEGAPPPVLEPPPVEEEVPVEEPLLEEEDVLVEDALPADAAYEAPVAEEIIEEAFPEEEIVEESVPFEEDTVLPGMDAEMTQPMEVEEEAPPMDIVELTEDAIVEEPIEVATPEMVTQEIGPTMEEEPPLEEAYAAPAERVSDARPYLIVDAPPKPWGRWIATFLVIVIILGGAGYAVVHFDVYGKVKGFVASGEPPVDPGPAETGATGPTPTGPDVEPPGEPDRPTEPDPEAERRGHVEALQYSLEDLLGRK